MSRQRARKPAAPAAPEPRVLGGRYQILERIGSGGMADVFRGRDERLHRDVAIKVLRPSYGQDPAFVARLRREARHAASVEHEYVAAIYDHGEDGGDHYIVMDHIPGPNLKELIRERGALPEDEALTLAARICEGLEAAHARGVIHRDLKPQNVVVDASGRPRILDFGIARAVGDTQITGTAAVVGTAHYLAPEQAQGGVADARSDLYSLGAVAFELLTGRVPFTGENAVEIAIRHLEEPPPVPSVVRPGLRKATDLVIARALAKDPAQRFQTAAELRLALLRARDGAGPLAFLPGQRHPPRRAASKAPMILAAAALLIVLAGTAATGALRGGPGTAERPAAAVGVSPTPTLAPTTRPSPAPTATPTRAVPPATARPTPAVIATTPAEGVAEFYRRINARDLSGAEELWTERMKANWPPASAIHARFADTRAISLTRNDTVRTDPAGGRATVGVEIVETTSQGTQRFGGTWELVRTPRGWLLDEPSLAQR